MSIVIQISGSNIQTTAVTVKDESSAVATFTYTDEDSAAVTPASVTWTLTDVNGNIINSREDVSIAVPSTTNSVMLSGDDLNRDDGEIRVITCDAVYTSATYGVGIPLRDQGQFKIGSFVEPIPS